MENYGAIIGFDFIYIYIYIDKGEDPQRRRM